MIIISLQLEWTFLIGVREYDDSFSDGKFQKSLINHLGDNDTGADHIIARTS
ncbi:hypothetical protein GCM10019994_38280 [Enterococcus raffinosus]